MNTDHGGFVLAYRRTLDHHAFKTHGEALAFTYLTMLAAWKPTRVRYKDRIMHLQRGQLVISIRDLADKLERTRQWSERFIDRLRTEAMIETTRDGNLSVITICNYSEYQCRTEDPETSEETAPGQVRDTEQRKERKERRKEGKKEEVVAVLPDFLAEADWLRWFEYRKERDGKAMTGATQRESIRRVTLAVEAGWDAGVVISHCIERGWRGIFTPQGDPRRIPVIGRERRKELEAELFRLRGTIESAPHMRDELMPQYWAVKKELENANP